MTSFRQVSWLAGLHPPQPSRTLLGKAQWHLREGFTADPAVNEVPEQFPAVVLWNFRIASIGAQLIMWATLGLLFGALSQRAADYQPQS